MAIAVAFIGILIMTSGVLLIIDYYQDRKTVRRIYGTVVGIEKYEVVQRDVDYIETSTVQYRPVIEYVLDGQTCRLGNTPASDMILYSLQQRVPLIASPDNPADLRLDSTVQRFVGVGSIVVGFIVCGVCWYIFEFDWGSLLFGMAVTASIVAAVYGFVRASHVHSLKEFLPKFREYYFSGRMEGVTFSPRISTEQQPTTLLTSREEVRAERARLDRSRKRTLLIVLGIGSISLGGGIWLYLHPLAGVPHWELIVFPLLGFGALLVVVAFIGLAGAP